jgi:molybdopterin molybdotransferase
MPLSYANALQILKESAPDAGELRSRSVAVEHVSIEETLGRSAAQTYLCPNPTPAFDSPAMDGYAISSSSSENATPDTPMTYHVKGSIAAGDTPLTLPNDPEKGVFPCVEIMTGAPFPVPLSGSPFDACVKVEDAALVQTESKMDTYIEITKPVQPYANRRLAGSDFQKQQVIIGSGETVGSNHVLALASVGVSKISVMRKLKVGVLSTGNELVSENGIMYTESQIRDANGPYLLSGLKSQNVDAKFLGVVKDDETQLLHTIRKSLERDQFDILISSGAVSAGKHDHIHNVIEKLGSDIKFHGVAVRPGHPILFASVPASHRPVYFFGLPGNPVAVATCFRFFVTPFIRCLQGVKDEQPSHACLRLSVTKENRTNSSKRAIFLPTHLDFFKHGTLKCLNQGRLEVELSKEQSPAKIAPLLSANCWIHIPPNRGEIVNGTPVECWTLSPDKNMS